MTIDKVPNPKPVWQVVEQCGYTGERVISEWSSFDDAYCAVKENYMPEEEDELHVCILKDGSSEY